MVIPISFNYKYKTYPFSERASIRSRQLGILTCGAMCLVYGLFWVMIFFALFGAIGIPGDPAVILSFISLIGMYFLIKKIKTSMAAKIDQMAIEDLMNLKDTNPEMYYQYIGQFQTVHQSAPSQAEPVQQTASAAQHVVNEPSAPAAEPKKFCGKCGAKIKPNSAFCHSCGSKL